MAISMKNIERNYELLLREGNYYEQEVFTKFEDAFLMETNPGRSSGITLLHGHRSFVSYTAGGVNYKKGELADVRLLMYSPSKKQIRQLFLQFKRYEDIIQLNPKQADLYNEHPDVSPCDSAKKYIFDRGVLNKSCSSDKEILHAGTMFATGYYDSGKAKLVIKTGDKSQYPLPSGKTAGNFWVPANDKSITSCVSVDKYEYCLCLTSMQELLQNMNECKVGMPVTYATVAMTVKEEMIPDELKKMKTDDFVVNQVSNLPVWTMFINVDELED